MKSLGKQSIQKYKSSTRFSNMLNEFGNRSSIHGLSYIFGNAESLCDRLLWLVIFISTGVGAVILTILSYNNWQDNLVITTLQDMDRVVEGMDFPAVTICASGLQKHLLEQTLKKAR